MTREHVLMILGVLTLLAPWSGLPLRLLEWILPLIGLAVVGIAFTLRARSLPPAPRTPPALPPNDSRSEPQSRSSHIAFS